MIQFAHIYVYTHEHQRHTSQHTASRERKAARGEKAGAAGRERESGGAVAPVLSLPSPPAPLFSPLPRCE